MLKSSKKLKLEALPEKNSDRLCYEIIEQIRSGKLKPGDRLLATSELSKLYDMPEAAAHRALTTLAQEGFVRRINGRGTFVEEHAPEIGENAAHIEAVALPAHTQHNPFHVTMIAEISECCRRQKIQTIVGDGQEELAFIDRMAANQVTDLVRFPLEVHDEPRIWAHLQEKKINTVVINDFWLDGGPFSSVRTDTAAGIAALVRHLTELGHTRIALIDENPDKPRIDAYPAYFRALTTAGVAFHHADILNLRDYSYRIAEMIPMLLERYTAAIVMYDFYAAELAEAMLAAGITLGKEFSLAGFDGTKRARDLDLTTAEQQVERLAQEAIRLLEDGREQKNPVKIKIEPVCAFRASTGPVWQHKESK